MVFACTPQRVAEVEVDPSTIGKHLERLASDEFMGRMPCTEGEIKTVNYLREEFIKLGTLPGNGESYFQEVPLIKFSGQPSEVLTISDGKDPIELKYYEDYMITTEKAATEVTLQNSELVFAGYGIVAPEYGWNDYEGIDWTGKTAVVLVNDPGYESGDTTLFKGNELTYYGRWTYKFEEAARQGAAGVLVIHETEPASYDWGVVQASFPTQYVIMETDLPVVDIEGWISSESAGRIFERSVLKGKDYKTLARSKDFRPIPLELTASVAIENNITKDVSKNVIAMIPGTDRKDECIIYTAHWDHFGIGKKIDGDSIYNGAVDDATGTAALLALAEAFKKNGPTKRSVVFIAFTCEEQGLFGSAYYAQHPIFEPEKTVANINMDGMMGFCPMKDLTIIGYGQSELDEYAREAAQAQGRYIMGDPDLDKGYYLRADHFNLAKIGIPALYASGSYEGFTLSKEEIKRLSDDYLANKYHQPSDEYDPETMDLKGIQLDVQLLYMVGLKLANEDSFPKWYEGSEFRAVREEE